MHVIDISAGELIESLFRLGEEETVCVLDSCGAGHLGSHLLIAGIEPVAIHEVTNDDPEETLRLLDRESERAGRAVFMTLAYEFGSKLNNIPFVHNPDEPDLFLASFDTIIVHDYSTAATYLTGNAEKFDAIAKKLARPAKADAERQNGEYKLSCNFGRGEYIDAVEKVQELIRAGDTYQTNLTMQFEADFGEPVNTAAIFRRLRKHNPAPFSAYIKRGDSTVISSSPERFFCVSGRRIETSPIKGTRPRVDDDEENERIKSELRKSEKDRAENVMIVDLLRNDIGRICEFGTVQVESLCELEEHPTLFHLVSTVSGTLRPAVRISDILRAVFPCGSITGAPKIRTMQIIDSIEKKERGLSMGAVGYSINGDEFALENAFDLNVAIRTITAAGNICRFNVGGGIVIDSEPAAEYDEALLKAKALIAAL